MIKFKENCFLILLFFSLLSCSQQDEVIYSCDETVNDWVQDHLTEIQQMNRENWLHVNDQVSIAVYRAFTADQRINFWRAKFEEVKNMSWSKDELMHIQMAENFVNSHLHFFSGEPLTDDQLDELESFFYKWQNEAMENLGWKKEVGLSIVATGNSLKNTKGEIIPLFSDRNDVMSVSAESKCNCNAGADFCFNVPGPCEESSCEEYSPGCGWLMLMACNGLCGGI